MTMSNPTPSPPSAASLFRTVGALRRDPLEFLVRARRLHGDVARIPLAHRTFYLLSHPDHVRHVLLDNARNYSKDTATYRKLRSLVGSSLLTSDDESWRRRRRLAQPAFHKERTAALGPVVTRATSAMLERWRHAATAGEPLDVAEEMMRLTREIVVSALLGSDLGEEAEAVGRAVREVLDHTKRRVESIFDIPTILPTPANVRFARALRFLEGAVDSLIDQRQEHGRADLLTRLRLACEADGGSEDPAHLRGEVLTMFIAGHETTANALTWAFYLLGQHPAVGARLGEESRTVLAGRSPSDQDLPRLPTTRMVVKEALRLYPPVWLVERRAIDDDEIGGFRIPGGSTVALSQYVTHRHPGIWTDPDAFHPERFAPDAPAPPPRFAYFPFGSGARQCIGGQFATMEAEMVLAMVMQTFRVAAPAGCRAVPEPGVTLRPAGPVHITVARVRDP